MYRIFTQFNCDFIGRIVCLKYRFFVNSRIQFLHLKYQFSINSRVQSLLMSFYKKKTHVSYISSENLTLSFIVKKKKKSVVKNWVQPQYHFIVYNRESLLATSSQIKTCYSQNKCTDVLFAYMIYD